MKRSDIPYNSTFLTFIPPVHHFPTSEIPTASDDMHAPEHNTHLAAYLFFFVLRL